MNRYTEKHGLFPPQIKKMPSPDLGLIVVIPCFNEPTAIKSLEALKKSNLPTCDVAVILLINQSEKASAEIRGQNKTTYEETTAWAKVNSTDRLQFHVLFHKALPAKHAGVGLARKIGMDEAVLRFEQVEAGFDGIIVCFDADSDCADNYLAEIERHFKQHPKTPACSIHYEHPLEGKEFDSFVYQCITNYELHLRYYVNALRYAGYPFAYQTIGSSMAVRSSAYQRQGGMNRRKAGEDFYFLQKFIPSGHFTELNTTKVIPSPRPSLRVPFGTGKAVVKMQEEMAETYYTYNNLIFKDLKAFVEKIPSLYSADAAACISSLPPSVQDFLNTLPFSKKMEEIKQHTASAVTFTQRFYQWFNAFQVLKYVHFARDHYYPDVDVVEAANWLWKAKYTDANEDFTGKELLLLYREMDRRIIQI